LKELEKYLNSKIGISNNKNLELLKLFFTKSQLADLSNRTIAVVGTNGKTSTVNFIHQLLKKNNKSSLMFTSPHLVEYTERIQSDKNLNLESNLDLVKDFEEKNNTILGYFETLFLLASQLFLDSELDYFVSEAGIGGKLDTTSVIQSQNVVLTSIGKDHQDLLGYTDHEVLNQKIYISSNIKNLFVGDINPELKNLILNNYPHSKVKYFLSDFINNLNIEMSDLSANQKNYLLALNTVSLLLEININNEVNNLGTIEGRFEIVNQNPLKVLDGAHNLDGIKHFFKDYENQFNYEKTDVFVGFKKGKDLESIISYINSKNKYSIYFIQENSFYDQENSSDYLEYFQKENIEYRVASLEAFSSNKNPSILLGSLYLIGEYKKRKLV
jgi:dihydrofolate synthase/folylpolyglutamate synthase